MQNPGFIFGGNTGMSYEDLQRRRQALEAAQARRSGQAPRNIGEGLHALGSGLAYGLQKRALVRQMKEGKAGAQEQWESLFGGQPAGPQPGEQGFGVTADSGQEAAPAQPPGVVQMAALAGNDYLPQGQQTALGLMMQQRMAAMQPAEPRVINGKLVNPQTGEVVGDYSDAPEWKARGFPSWQAMKQFEASVGRQPQQRQMVEQGGVQYWADTGEPVIPNAAPPQPDPTSAMREYEMAKAQGYSGSFLDYQTGIKEAGRSSVNVNTGETADAAFAKEQGKATASMLSDLATQGVNARSDLTNIGELENLLDKGVGGTRDAWASWAQNKLGVNIGAGGSVEAFNALINRLIPTQRPPGSGVMSDRDVEMFRQSLPTLVNSPGGNTQILETMRAMAEYKRQAGDIARQVMTGRIDRRQGLDELYDLPDPLANLRQRIGSRQSDPQGGDIGNGISAEKPTTPTRRRYDPATGKFEEVR